MPFPPDATLADVGEFGLIAELTPLFAQGDHVLVGPGDDAAVLRVRTGHVVVSTDLVVEGRHFRSDWAEAADVGERGVRRERHAPIRADRAPGVAMTRGGVAIG